MKYYIYISDAKVDMLLPQIPHNIKKKVATEFGFDLKVLTAKRKVESESEDNRVSRLEAVVAFIRGYGNLGTVDEPDEYVEGNLPMRWGEYGGVYEPPSPVVYFGGETAKTVVGLGGSTHHLIGNNSGGQEHPNSSSLSPYLMEYLLKELKISPGDDRFRSWAVQSLDPEDANITVLEAVILASSVMRGPTHNIEFVAKRLAYGKPRYRGHFRTAVLATPLYIAMAD